MFIVFYYFLKTDFFQRKKEKKMLNTTKAPLKSLISRVLSGNLSASRSLASKPFYYQELFEHAKPLDIPYKKLTGKIFVLFSLSHLSIESIS